MNLKDYKQVSSIYTTTDDSIFYIDEENNRKVDDDAVNEIERLLLEGYPIWPLVVDNYQWGLLVRDGQHRLQAIKNINKTINVKIEIPFYLWYLGYVIQR